MSDIPKSKRAHSNLEAHHQALAVRRMISVELLSSFAYSEKKLEAAVKKQTAHIQDPEHKKDVAEAIRSLENDYACWFIKRHRDRVDDLACAIAQHIRAANLYKAIGMTETGYPVWVQPLGATDAYNMGDIVSYNGALYISTIDGNVWAPDAYPAGWKAYAE